MKNLLTITLSCGILANNTFAQFLPLVGEELLPHMQEFFHEAYAFSEDGQFATLGEYEWDLSKLSVNGSEVVAHQVPADKATPLGAALTELVEDFGHILEDDAMYIETKLANIIMIGQDENVYDEIEDNHGLANISRETGKHLQADAANISAAIVRDYNKDANSGMYNLDPLNKELPTILFSNSTAAVDEIILQDVILSMQEIAVEQSVVPPRS